MKGGRNKCPGKMIAGVLRKSIVVMIGGNLKKSIIVMMIGGNLKKSVIVMMIGVLNEISVVVNVSLFVAIVKEKIGNIFNVNVKKKICLLESIRLFRKVDPSPTSLLSLNF
ncbi:hypothetical protein [Bacillus thuringiensis]|uniref:hypothetical protein n=1 Tax=Bacillus thuringiensis TaxID=1428 RepID=UPI0015D49E78